MAASGAAMNQASREALELVVEKAARLFQGDYARWWQEHRGTALQIGVGEDGTVTINHTRPTATQRDALILTFRFFIQKNEHSSFRWLAQHVLTDPTISDEWKREFAKAHDVWNDWLDSSYQLTEFVPNTAGQFVTHDLTRREILEVFVYGDAAHATKKQALDDWRMNPPWFAQAESEFDLVLQSLLLPIKRLKEVCEAELDAGSF